MFPGGSAREKRDVRKARRSFGLAERDIAGFLSIVRAWLTWLLVFGVIAGLSGRVLAVDHICGQPKTSHECCGDHHHDKGDSDQDKDQHGPDCPPGPHDHHTHACCHPAPLAGVDVRLPGLLPPGVSRLDLTWHRSLPPDEPVFALDKPPLI